MMRSRAPIRSRRHLLLAVAIAAALAAPSCGGADDWMLPARDPSAFGLAGAPSSIALRVASPKVGWIIDVAGTRVAIGEGGGEMLSDREAWSRSEELLVVQNGSERSAKVIFGTDAALDPALRGKTFVVELPADERARTVTLAGDEPTTMEQRAMVLAQAGALLRPDPMLDAVPTRTLRVGDRVDDYALSLAHAFASAMRSQRKVLFARGSVGAIRMVDDAPVAVFVLEMAFSIDVPSGFVGTLRMRHQLGFRADGLPVLRRLDAQAEGQERGMRIRSFTRVDETRRYRFDRASTSDAR